MMQIAGLNLENATRFFTIAPSVEYVDIYLPDGGDGKPLTLRLRPDIAREVYKLLGEKFDVPDKEKE